MERLIPVLLVGVYLLAAFPAVEGQQSPEAPAGFTEVSEHPALAWAVDLHEDSVAWASPGDARVDIRVANLTAGEEELVTSIPDPEGNLSIQSLAYDGRFVVWIDDRFGNDDVFTIDTGSNELRRLTSHPADAEDVDASEGRAVWAEQGGVHMASLGTGETVVFQERTGPNPAPAIDGDRVAWSQANRSERYIMVREEGVPSPLVVVRDENIARVAPRLQEDLIVWRAIFLPGPEEDRQEPKGVRAQLASVATEQTPDGPVLETRGMTNLTPLMALKNLDIGGDRVAWLEPGANGTPRLSVRSLTEPGDSVLVSAPIGPGHLSDSHLVIVRPQDGTGPLYALAWDQTTGVESSDGIGPNWYLAGAGILLVVLGLLWGPIKDLIASKRP